MIVESIMGDFPGKMRMDSDAEGDRLHIVIFAPFSGHPTLRSEKRQVYVRWDSDDLEKAFRAFKPQCHWQGSVLSFHNIHDFHPDALFPMVKLRAFNIPDHITKASASSDLDHDEDQENGNGTSDPHDDLNLMNQVIDQTVERPDHDPWLKALIKNVSKTIPRHNGDHSAKHPTEQQKSDDQKQNDWADHMRALLHYPEFQDLERVWRSLFFLHERIGHSTAAQIHLVDMTKDEFICELMMDDHFKDSVIYKTLFGNKLSAGTDWRPSLVITDYEFGMNTQDVMALSKLAGLCQHAEVCFVASGSSDMLSEEANLPDYMKKLWHDLRNMPESSHIGLGMQRFLLRLPYGQRLEKIQSFKFEEMQDNISETERYHQCLWGQFSFLFATSVVHHFMDHGWAGLLPKENVIKDLPLYTFKNQDEIMMMPCGEMMLTDRDMEKILQLGFMPIQSHYARDYVRLPKLQSISLVHPELSGPWK